MYVTNYGCHELHNTSIHLEPVARYGSLLVHIPQSPTMYVTKYESHELHFTSIHLEQVARKTHVGVATVDLPSNLVTGWQRGIECLLSIGTLRKDKTSYGSLWGGYD